ncbi:MAG: hypothetical protein KME43_21065 [Myxacorys chilensis ATA2-1-KO14]|jgi:hypothetical protein|nr:hypothetical protein [Myxacorys chilensis ATA2-1-KO14]
MKRQFLAILALTSIVAGSTALSLPAQAGATCREAPGKFSYDRKDFNYWEHPFACDNNIGKMSQGQANAFCKTMFGFYAIGKFVTAKGVPRNPHIWGHLNNRLCVYNTNK